MISSNLSGTEVKYANNILDLSGIHFLNIALATFQSSNKKMNFNGMVIFLLKGDFFLKKNRYVFENPWINASHTSGLVHV